MTQRPLKLSVSTAELNLPITTAFFLLLVLLNAINLPVATAIPTIRYPHHHSISEPVDNSQQSPFPTPTSVPSLTISAAARGVILNANLLCFSCDEKYSIAFLCL